MDVDVLSLFPQCFIGPFDESIIKRARENKLLNITLVDIRDFADNKHRRVDDRPYGGGPGMVMMAEPVTKAIRSVKRSNSHVVYMSPQGKPLTAEKCRELAEKEHLIVLCGHYEGVDERALESDVDEEISIGPYVLTSGCLPAMVLIDAAARFIPGVLGNEESAEADSFENGTLDCPHYTRPEVFEGKSVPDVLLSGNHKKIAQWRSMKSREKTAKLYPKT
ncbi:MAG: tRNA (guanosine(37)-N1)-methyltransferase TrmD [Chlamydiales bacterium]|nr:tRNA (guanosine(37)-N1)-methyltransferase TrmD [Chlamydiia bacterium]MCP5508240.1 tRNA (guanosine(37)-N1)-methyltransferase TrmD [Chlamydiales bacterium]